MSQQVLFLVDIIITLIAIVFFNFLPEPMLPENAGKRQSDFMASFKSLMVLFKQPKMLKLYGIFVNSAYAAGIGQGLLLPFYCMILKEEPLSE